MGKALRTTEKFPVDKTKVKQGSGDCRTAKFLELHLVDWFHGLTKEQIGGVSRIDPHQYEVGIQFTERYAHKGFCRTNDISEANRMFDAAEKALRSGSYRLDLSGERTTFKIIG